MKFRASKLLIQKLKEFEGLSLVAYKPTKAVGNLKKSTLLKKIMHDAPTAEIQREFMKWVKSGGKQLAGLVKRRRWESERWVE